MINGRCPQCDNPRTDKFDCFWCGDKYILTFDEYQERCSKNEADRYTIVDNLQKQVTYLQNNCNILSLELYDVQEKYNNYLSKSILLETENIELKNEIAFLELQNVKCNLELQSKKPQDPYSAWKQEDLVEKATDLVKDMDLEEPIDITEYIIKDE